jgi:hypothetical protein
VWFMEHTVLSRFHMFVCSCLSAWNRLLNSDLGMFAKNDDAFSFVPNSVPYMRELWEN